MEITRESTLDAWLAALREIRMNGSLLVDNDNRSSRELLNLVISIACPEEDITAPIEVMRGLKKWSYPELEELEDVFFRKEGAAAYYYTYGARMFSFAGVKDQVDDFVVPLLQRTPNSRRAIITLYNPLVDSKLIAKETPSLISMHFKIVEGKLLLSVLLRSNDMFIGWPANIYQVFLLQKYVAGKLGVGLGAITTISHSAHIFGEYSEEIEEVLNKKSR